MSADKIEMEGATLRRIASTPYSSLHPDRILRALIDLFHDTGDPDARTLALKLTLMTEELDTCMIEIEEREDDLEQREAELAWREEELEAQLKEDGATPAPNAPPPTNDGVS